MRVFYSALLGFAGASHLQSCMGPSGSFELDDEKNEATLTSSFDDVVYAFYGENGADRDIFRVYSKESSNSVGTPNREKRWVTKVAAELLDQDLDGVPDDQEVAKCLREAKAHIAILDTTSDEAPYWDNLSLDFKGGTVEPLFERNLHDSLDHNFNWLLSGAGGHFNDTVSDKRRTPWENTIQQVSAIINQVGYACAYPWHFGAENSLLKSAYDQARADNRYKGRMNHKDYDDDNERFGQVYKARQDEDGNPSCDERCEMTHYLFLGQAVSMGIFDGSKGFDWSNGDSSYQTCTDNVNIGEVWDNGCTKAELETKDPMLYTLVNRLDNHLPNKYPSGHYCPPMGLAYGDNEEGNTIEDDPHETGPVTDCFDVNPCNGRCGFNTATNMDQNAVQQMDKFIDVLDSYVVYGEAGVREENLRFVASVVGYLLDNNEDGVIDVPSLGSTLKSKKAHIAVFKRRENFQYQPATPAYTHYAAHYFDHYDDGTDGTFPIVLFEDQVDPRNPGLIGWDNTLPYVIKTFLRFGLSHMNPAKFSTTSEQSDLYNAETQAIDNVWFPDIYFGEFYANDAECEDSPQCSIETFFSLATIGKLLYKTGSDNGLFKHDEIMEDIATFPGENAPEDPEDGTTGWWRKAFKVSELDSELPVFATLSSGSEMASILQTNRQNVGGESRANWRPDKNYCAVPVPDDDITTCFTTETLDLNNEPPAFHGLKSRIKVNDFFSVLAEEDVDDKLLRYVASNVARLLDQDNNGKADDEAVGIKLAENQAHIVIFKKDSTRISTYMAELDNSQPTIPVTQVWKDNKAKYGSFQYLTEDQIDPYNPGMLSEVVNDRTTLEVLKVILRFGLVDAHPNVFSTGCSAQSVLASQRSIAQQGEGAWYQPNKVDNHPCAALPETEKCACQDAEFFAYSALTMQGIMYEECNNELWNLCYSSDMAEASIPLIRFMTGVPIVNDVEVNIRQLMSGLAMHRPDRFYCYIPEDPTPAPVTDVTTCFDIVPNEKQNHADYWPMKHLSKMIDVFGDATFTVYAEADVPDWQVRYVASNAASMLDLNEDGQVDDADLATSLRENYAHIAIFSNATNQEQYEMNYDQIMWSEDMSISVTAAAEPNRWPASLYFLEIDPLNPGVPGKDKTTSKILQNFVRFGLSQMNWDKFGYGDQTVLTQQMINARDPNDVLGNPFTSNYAFPPFEYPAEAWFTNQDVTCDFYCQQDTYFAWSVLELQSETNGPLTGIDCSSISDEWSVCSKQPDHEMIAILKNEEFASFMTGFATVPNRHYCASTVTVEPPTTTPLPTADYTSCLPVVQNPKQKAYYSFFYLPQYVNVLGYFDVFAEEGVGHDKIVYVAAAIASYLDRDENGQPDELGGDDWPMKLHRNRGHIAIFKKREGNNVQVAYQYYHEHYHMDFGGEQGANTPAVLFADEINPSQPGIFGKDKTLFVMFKNFMRFAFSELVDFGHSYYWGSPSAFLLAMENMRGGVQTQFPLFPDGMSYPETATYKNYNCEVSDLRCQLEEYFAYTVLTLNDVSTYDAGCVEHMVPTYNFCNTRLIDGDTQTYQVLDSNGLTNYFNRMPNLQYCPSDTTNPPPTEPSYSEPDRTMGLFDGEITDCFNLTGVDGRPDILGGPAQELRAYMKVLDTFEIYADDDVDPLKVRYVASIIASFLDYDNDGETDSEALKAKFQDNRGHVVICKADDDNCQYYTTHYHQIDATARYERPDGTVAMDHAALLYEDDIWPSESGKTSKDPNKLFEDKTYFVIYRNFHRFGLADLFPAQFGIGGNSELHQGLVAAWGGVDYQQGITTTLSNKDAWYKNSDQDCSYRCHHETYFAFTAMMHLGGQQVQNGMPNICKVYDVCDGRARQLDPLVNGRMLDKWPSDTFEATRAMGRDPKPNYNGCDMQTAAYSFLQQVNLPTDDGDDATDRSCWNEQLSSHDSGIVNFFQVADCFKVYIDSDSAQVDPRYGQYVASVALSLLDKDSDGLCDDDRLSAMLQQTQAHVAIFKNDQSDNYNNFQTMLAQFSGDETIDEVFIFTDDFVSIGTSGSPIYRPSQNPTVAALLKAILRFGLEQEWSFVFYRTIRSAGPAGAILSHLNHAVDIARGGHYIEAPVPPNKYKVKEGYTEQPVYFNYDSNCDYQCQSETMLVYSFMMVMNIFRDEQDCYQGPMKEMFPFWTTPPEKHYCDEQAIINTQKDLAFIMLLTGPYGPSPPSWINAIKNLKQKPADNVCPPITKSVNVPEPVTKDECEDCHFLDCFDVGTNDGYEATDEALDLAGATHAFPKRIRLLNGAFNIFAEAEVSDDKIQYVAAVVSSMLDRGQHGKVRHKPMGDALISNKAHIVICHDEKTVDTNPICNNYESHWNQPYPGDTYPTGAHLWDNEINIRQRFELPHDWTQFKVARALMRFGVAHLESPLNFKDEWDIKAPEGKKLSEKVKAARGGIEFGETLYPDHAYFTNKHIGNFDKDCNYQCVIEHYLVWGMLQVSGAIAQHSCNEWPGLNAEWKICTMADDIQNGEGWNADGVLRWFNNPTAEWFNGFVQPHNLKPNLAYGKKITNFCPRNTKYTTDSFDVSIQMVGEPQAMTYEPRTCWDDNMMTADATFKYPYFAGKKVMVVHDNFYVVAGDENVSMKALRYVAACAGSMLDNDRNGEIDDDEFGRILGERKPYIAIFKNQNQKYNDYVAEDLLNGFSPMRRTIFEDDIVDYHTTGVPRIDPTIDRLLRVFLWDVLTHGWDNKLSVFGINSELDGSLGGAVYQARAVEWDIQYPCPEPCTHQVWPAETTYKNFFKELPCGDGGNDAWQICMVEDLFTNTILYLKGMMNHGDTCKQAWIDDVYNWNKKTGGCGGFIALQNLGQTELAKVLHTDQDAKDLAPYNSYYGAIMMLRSTSIDNKYCPISTNNAYPAVTTAAPPEQYTNCFEIVQNPFPYAAMAYLPQYVNVIGYFHVFAEAGVGADKIMYVASAIAAYLDPSRDGQPEDNDFAMKLHNSMGHIAIFAKSDNEHVHVAYQYYDDHYHMNFGGSQGKDTPAVLFADEIDVRNPGNLRDKTVSQIMKNFVRFGFSQYPEFRDTYYWGAPGQVLLNMEAARGDAATFVSSTDPAWYISPAGECELEDKKPDGSYRDDLRCLVEEYFALSVLTLQGAGHRQECKDVMEPKFLVCGKDFSNADPNMSAFFSTFPEPTSNLMSRFSQPPTAHYCPNDGASATSSPGDQDITTTTEAPVTIGLYDGEISDCFNMSEPAPNTLKGADQHLEQFINVLDVFEVYADAAVLPGKVRYVASIIASFLDGNNDGVVDDHAFGNTLKENKAHVVICLDDDYNCRYYTDHYGLAFPQDQLTTTLPDMPNRQTDHAALLYDHEVMPSMLGKASKDSSKLFEDKTLFVVYRNLYRFGLVHMKPDVFGWETPSILHDGLIAAWGGEDHKVVPSSFGPQAWYKNLDKTCNYRCQHEQYFAYTALMHLGGQQIQNGFPNICSVYDACNNRLIKCDWVPGAICDTLVSDRLLDGNVYGWETHSYTKQLAIVPTAFWQGCKAPQTDGIYGHNPDSVPQYLSCLADSIDRDVNYPEDCIRDTDTCEQTHQYLKRIKVADCFTVYSEDNVEDKYMLHAARIAGNLLDHNKDGFCDDLLLAEKLKENKAHIAIFNDDNAGGYHIYKTDLNPEMLGPDSGYDKYPVIFKTGVKHIDQYSTSNLGAPVNNDNYMDVTTRQIMRVLLRQGLEKQWPEAFGRDFGSDSLLTVAMDDVRGGQFENVPAEGYPERATYHNRAANCLGADNDYQCQAEELFVYTCMYLSSVFNCQGCCTDYSVTSKFKWGQIERYTCSNSYDFVNRIQPKLATALALPGTFSWNQKPQYFDTLTRFITRPQDMYCPDKKQTIDIKYPESEDEQKDGDLSCNRKARSEITIQQGGRDAWDDNFQGTSHYGLYDACGHFEKVVFLFPGDSPNQDDFGFVVFADQGVSDEHVLYVSYKVSSMLDRLSTGKIADPLLREKLVANTAHIALASVGDNFGGESQYSQHYKFSHGDNPQIWPAVEPKSVYPSDALLWNNEIRISKENQMQYDKTQFKLMRAIIRYGIAHLPGYVDEMDITHDQDKKLSEWLKDARGNHDSTEREAFGTGAWYVDLRSAAECNYRCMIEEFTTIIMLWGERRIANGQLVVEEGCLSWHNLGDRFLCSEMGPWPGKSKIWQESELLNYFRADHIGGVDSAWRKSLLRPPRKDYGECEQEGTWSLYAFNNNAEEEEDSCFNLIKNADGSKQITLFPGVHVKASSAVDLNSLYYVSRLLGNMLDPDDDGVSEVMDLYISAGKVGPWTAWSACSALCGTGFRTRTRVCESGSCKDTNMYETKDCQGEQGSTCDQSVKDGGHFCEFPQCRTCPNLDPADDQPIPGEIGEWDGWSECTAKCGMGTQTQRRCCTKGNCGWGGLVETRDCGHENPPCEVDPSPEVYVNIYSDKNDPAYSENNPEQSIFVDEIDQNKHGDPIKNFVMWKLNYHVYTALSQQYPDFFDAENPNSKLVVAMNKASDNQVPGANPECENKNVNEGAAYQKCFNAAQDGKNFKYGHEHCWLGPNKDAECRAINYFINTQLFFQTYMGSNICNDPLVSDVFAWSKLGGGDCGSGAPFIKEKLRLTGELWAQCRQESQYHYSCHGVNQRPDDYPESLWKTMKGFNRMPQAQKHNYCPIKKTTDEDDNTANPNPPPDQESTVCLAVESPLPEGSSYLNGEDAVLGGLSKAINVLDGAFVVLADSKVPDYLVKYVASVAATALDRGEDGVIDSIPLGTILKANKAHIVICHDTNSITNDGSKGSEKGECFNYYKNYMQHNYMLLQSDSFPAMLRESDISTSYEGVWGEDLTMINVFRNIFTFGLSHLHEAELKLGSRGHSVMWDNLVVAMNNLKTFIPGTSGENLPGYNKNCGWDCKMSFYFSIGALMRKKKMTDHDCKADSVRTTPNKWGIKLTDVYKGCYTADYTDWEKDPLIKNNPSFWSNPKFGVGQDGERTEDDPPIKKGGWSQGIFENNSNIPNGKYGACEEADSTIYLPDFGTGSNNGWRDDFAISFDSYGSSSDNSATSTDNSATSANSCSTGNKVVDVSEADGDSTWMVAAGFKKVHVLETLTIYAPSDLPARGNNVNPLKYVADVAANMLDGSNSDGVVNNEALKEAMVSEKARIFILPNEAASVEFYANEGEMWGGEQRYPPLIYLNQISSDMYKPGVPTKDRTIFTIIHAIHRWGLAIRWPYQFDESYYGPSLLRHALIEARGHHYQNYWPITYDEESLANAIYRERDTNCNFECQTSELLGWTMSTLSGLLHGLCDKPSITLTYDLNNQCSSQNGIRSYNPKMIPLLFEPNANNTHFDEYTSALEAMKHIQWRYCPTLNTQVATAPPYVPDIVDDEIPMGSEDWLKCDKKDKNGYAIEVITMEGTHEDWDDSIGGPAAGLKDAAYHLKTWTPLFPIDAEKSEYAFHIFSDGTVSHDKILYVAYKLSSILDRNQDGNIDDDEMRDQLFANKAHIVLCGYGDPVGACSTYKVHYAYGYGGFDPDNHEGKYPSDAALYSNEVRISKEGQMEHDKTQFKLMRAVIRYGMSKMSNFEDKMDLLVDEGKFLSLKMKAARGGKESGDRGVAGTDAWYISQKTEDECNYRCFVEEYATLMALWSEKDPVNPPRVIRKACRSWDNLGGLFKCMQSQYTEFMIWQKDNEMFQMFDQYYWKSPGLLKPPQKNYGECMKWSTQYTGLNTDEEYELMMQNCHGFTIVRDPDFGTSGIKSIEIFPAQPGKNEIFRTVVYAETDVSDLSLKYVASTYASLFDKNGDGIPEVLDPEGANIYIWTSKDSPAWAYHGLYNTIDVSYDIFENEIGKYDKFGRPDTDRTVWKLLHHLLVKVLAVKWPDHFDPYSEDSYLSQARFDADGGQEDLAECRYKPGAVFTKCYKTMDDPTAFPYIDGGCWTGNDWTCRNIDLFVNTMLMLQSLIPAEICEKPFINDIYHWKELHENGCQSWGALQNTPSYSKLSNLMGTTGNKPADIPDEIYKAMVVLMRRPQPTYCNYNSGQNTSPGGSNPIGGTTAAPHTEMTPIYEGPDFPQGFSCLTSPAGIPGTEGLRRYIGLFDGAFAIYGDEEVSCHKMQHLAALISDMLDRDRNGEIDEVITDNDSLEHHLRINKAHMVVCKTNDADDANCNAYKATFDEVFEKCDDEVEHFKNKPYVIREYDINAWQPGVLTNDKTLFVAIQNIFRFGLQYTQPSMFGTRCQGTLDSTADNYENWSQLRIATNLARGDAQGENEFALPDEILYPAPEDGVHTAWFTNRDRDCNARCQMETYFAWHVYHHMIGQPTETIRLERNHNGIKCDERITYEWNTCVNGWSIEAHDHWSKTKPFYQSQWDGEKNIYYIPEGFMRTPSVHYQPLSVQVGEDVWSEQPPMEALVNQVCDELEVVDLPDDAPEYAAKLKQYVELFDGAFKIYAQKNIDKDKVLHVAYVMGSLLDADYDGKIDNSRVEQNMRNYEAHIAIFQAENNAAHEHYNENIWGSNASHYSKNLYLLEAWISKHTMGVLKYDRTLEICLKQLYQIGFVTGFDKFGYDWDSSPTMGNFDKFNQAMNEARGSKAAFPFNDQENIEYPQSATYRPVDPTCNYQCQSSEYFVYVAMAMMGTLYDSRNDNHPSRDIFLPALQSAQKGRDAIQKYQPLAFDLFNNTDQEQYGSALVALNQRPKNFNNKYKTNCQMHFSVTETTTSTTTPTTTTPSPWNEEVCNEDANKVNTWMRSNRGKKITRAGENTYMIRLKMSKADEDNLYTMFLTWGKKNCGVDFITKLGNGGVRIDIMDKVAEYKFVGKFTGQESKHYNTVFQYENQREGLSNCDGCLGGTTDQMELIVHFVEQVEWGTKDPATCLATLRAGYLGDYKAPEYTADDVTPCVSWVQKFW